MLPWFRRWSTTVELREPPQSPSAPPWYIPRWARSSLDSRRNGAERGRRGRIEQHRADAPCLGRVVGDDAVALARQVDVADVGNLRAGEALRTKSAERVHQTDLLARREIRLDVLAQDAEQRRGTHERVELAVAQLGQDRADHLLLAHDTARVAAPVVPEARVADRLRTGQVLPTRLQVHVQMPPRVVVVDRAVASDVFERGRVFDVEVDATERVDQILRR